MSVLRLRLCAEADIPDRAARGFCVPFSRGAGRSDLERLEILVARRGERLFAYENRCPHRGTTLDWAPHRFMTADSTHLQCATHGAQFRVEDGVCVYGPCMGQALAPLTIECVDGEVWLMR
jgi:nitrite reductase/ring-hydroxylating ferredoxin subunit